MYTPSLVIKKTREGYLFEEFIYCGCNCGFTRPKYDKHGRELKYIAGHQNRGKLNPMYGIVGEKAPSYGRRGELCPAWKGNNVGMEALHVWVRKRLPKPEFCEICKQVPPYDLANITGIYNRDLKNWGWFCRRCHLKYDNVKVRSEITIKNNKNLTSKNLDSYLESSDTNPNTVEPSVH